MAFEAYLDQRTLAPTRGRRITFVVSLVVHGAALLAAVAYSFWHVEEVTPPVVTVTFVSAAAAPAPPPPPAALGGGAAAAPKAKAVARPKVEVAAKLPEIVQPRKQPLLEAPPPQEKSPVKDEPTPPAAEPAPTNPDNKAGAGAGVGGPGNADGTKNGVVGGKTGGVVGGAASGTTGAPAAKFLPPQIGAQQKLSGALPDFPSHLATPGANFLVMAKICVGPAGEVTAVTLIKRGQPTLDDNVLAAVKTWRFRPVMANGTPVPFCYFGRFPFTSE